MESLHQPSTHFDLDELKQNAQTYQEKDIRETLYATLFAIEQQLESNPNMSAAKYEALQRARSDAWTFLARLAQPADRAGQQPDIIDLYENQGQPGAGGAEITEAHWKFLLSQLNRLQIIAEKKEALVKASKTLIDFLPEIKSTDIIPSMQELEDAETQLNQLLQPDTTNNTSEPSSDKSSLSAALRSLLGEESLNEEYQKFISNTYTGANYFSGDGAMFTLTVRNAYKNLQDALSVIMYTKILAESVDDFSEDDIKPDLKSRANALGEKAKQALAYIQEHFPLQVKEGKLADWIKAPQANSTAADAPAAGQYTLTNLHLPTFTEWSEAQKAA